MVSNVIARNIDDQVSIRPLRSQCTEGKYCELCRAMESLGGVRCDERFLFPTDRRRAAVAEVLGDRFGTRYFELV